MLNFLEQLSQATWLWLPLLIVSLIQGLLCPPEVKQTLHKMCQYYLVAMVGLLLLIPSAHPNERIILLDLATRVFLFIQAAETFWMCWHSWRGTGPQLANDVDLPLLTWYAISALLCLGWTALGVAFLTLGM